jgi:amino acid transporter
MLGVLPWRQMLESKFVVSEFMEQLHGRGAAVTITLMILWTAFGSVFALLLGYSRIPYAAALDGYFFSIFGRLHPTKKFPYVSLLVIGAISIGASFVSLGTVIDALITTRIVVQFMGQVGALAILRKRAPELARPYKMWLYPLPALVALAGWLFVYLTTDVPVILAGLGTLVAGIVAFLVWSWRVRSWPFALAASRP